MSEDDFWGMLPREFRRRSSRAANQSRHDDESAWGRSLLVANQIRSALGAEPLSLDDLRAPALLDLDRATIDDLWNQLDERRRP